MHIAVCVKAVPDRIPDPEIFRRPDASGEVHMNEWDAVAVETALQLRSLWEDGRVTVLCAGPCAWETVLRRALGMGADGGLRVDMVPDSVDPADAARALAVGIRHLQPDLILCGGMGEDGMQAAGGPMLATALDLPFCAMAVKLEPHEGGMLAACEEEGGKRRMYGLPFPCLVTVQTGIHAPRYPRLSLMLKADRMEIPVLSFEKGKKPAVILEGLEIPPPSRRVRFLEGNREEKARVFLEILEQRGWLRYPEQKGAV